MIIPVSGFSATTCNSLFTIEHNTHLPSKIKYLKLAIQIPLAIAIGGLVWHQIDQKIFWPKLETAVATHVLTETESNKTYYDHLIDSDFRFRDIKDSIFDPRVIEIDPRLKSISTQKRMSAYNLRKNYVTYYKMYSKIKNPQNLSLSEEIELFGDNPLFRHLDFFFKNGVTRYPGAFVAPQDQGPISDKNKKKLFDLTHEMYQKYLVAEVLFYGKDQERFIQKSPIAKSIYNDPYTQKLISYYKKNIITKDQLLYYVQENIQNNYYFSIFDTLKIVIFKNENGKYTNERLTLDDLRESRLTLLRTRQSLDHVTSTSSSIR